MQRPNHRGQQGELESAMETLNISRDSHQSPPQPQPQSQSQPQPLQARASREASSSKDSDQHHHENPAQAGSSGSQHSAPKASPEEWYLKSIDFTSPSGVTRTYKVITQNYNGPCSFIAICNILILRGQIKILPPERRSVSYELLAQLVGEHILLTAPDVDVSAALSMMPLTLRGMDLNPVFASSTTFRPATTGGELALFSSAGISLVHGWLVDPESPEYAAVSHVKDYDSAMNLIVEADVLTRGMLMGNGAEDDWDGAGPSQAGPSDSGVNLSEGERRKVEDAFAVRTFLDNTRSQLTYTGLFTLASLPADSTSSSKPSSNPEPTSPSSDQSTASEPNSPPHPEFFALFRNSHLSVLYRHAGALYTLVTDQVFLNEPSVVWERIEDVDQGAAVFVDSAFERATPVGGDWAGWTPPSETLGTVDPVDRALALELQNEEDERAQRAYAKRGHERATQRRREQGYNEERRGQGREDEKRKEKTKKEKECVIM